MADSNKVGQQAYQNANPQINGEIIDAAEKATQPVDVVETQETEITEQAPAQTPITGTVETSEQVEEFPTGGFSPVVSFTEKSNMLAKSGQLIYPTYRTLSDEQRRSYVKATDLPDFQRKVLQSELAESYKNTGWKNAKNAAVIYAMNLLSGSQTELALGNALMTQDFGYAASLGAEVAGGAIGYKAATQAGKGFIGRTAMGAIGAAGAGSIASLFIPTELGSDDTLESYYQKIYGTDAGFKEAQAKIKESFTKGDITEEMYNRQLENLETGRTDYLKRQTEFQRMMSREELRKSGLSDKEIDAIGKESIITTIGRRLAQDALEDIEYKAAIAPQVDPESIAAMAVGAATSMSELLLVGGGTKMLARKAALANANTGRFRPKKGTLLAVETPAKTYAPEVAQRYASMKGGAIGSAAATGVMSADIMGQGSLATIQKYIEETGDTDLSEYKGDLKNLAIDTFSTHIQNVIEHKLGVGPIIKNKRILNKWGEYLNGFLQEFFQGEITDIAELTKGNQTFEDLINNIPTNLISGGFGGAFQGTLGAALHSYYHRKNVDALTEVIMGQSTPENPINEKDARAKADAMMIAMEEDIAVNVVQEISDFTGATNYTGRIYETVRDNVKQAIDYQRNAMKDTIDGSKFDEMTEQELAQHIESVAQDTTDRAVIDALDRKKPLSESALLKGETIDGSYYLEGSDYVKETKAKAEAERQKTRELVYARRQAEKEAKATAREAQQAERTAQREAQKAAKLKEKSQADFLSGNAVYDAQGNRTMASISELETMPEIRQRISVYNTLKDQIQLTDKQVDTLNNTVKRLERKLLKFQREAINTANGDQLAQFLKRNKVDVRYFTTTADYRKAALKIADKWDLDEEAVPTDKRAYRTPTAQLEQQIAQTEDLLLRAGLTREQIAVMSDEEYQAAIEATDEYKAMVAENAKIAELGAELEDVDIQFQDVANEMARLDSENPPYTGETININGVERTVYNSNGDRIAQSEPALRNFYAWFGDSKVVDEQGRPLVVYHGSDVSFDVFDNTINQEKERQIGADKGYFFTDNKKVAEKFRTPEQRKSEQKYYYENTVVEQVEEKKYDKQGRYLGSITMVKATPAPYKNFGLFNVYLKAENVVEYHGEQIGVGQEREAALVSAQMSGKDGVIIYQADTGAGIANEYVVFKPNQIKSTDNRGTFSIETGNIYYQRQAQSGKGGVYDARNRSITLGAKADATTFPHEFAHYWIDKNFKWARSGNASTAWMRQWQAVEKWLGIDPEDKFLDKSASEKFARAYERFLADEQLPLVLQKSMADFRDYVLDHYDFDLDEAKGLQDKFGRPIVLDDSIKEWFRKSIYDEYTSPAESLVVDTRLDQMDTEAQVAKIVVASTNEIQDTAQESPIVESIPTGTEIQTEAGITNRDVLGKRKIGGGEMKESQGAIGQQIGATYESTTWEIQREMAKDYLSKVSIDEAIESLIDGTYPDKMDANFLRAELVERLNELGRFDEAAQLVVETSASYTAAAQELQGARATQTPFQMAIEQIVAIKTEKLARAKYGNNKKAVSKLDAALDKIIAKYEKQFLEAKTDEEIDAIYDAIQADGVRAIGSLNKRPADDGLQFQTTEEKREQAKETKARKKRGSIKAYRSRAKALLKKSLGITPTKAQIREINRLSVDVSKAITEYRKKVRTDKASAIDSTPALNAQNALNNYMVEQVGQSWLAKSADALNSYMMANMLWNPATQFKNIVGNTIQAIPHLLGSIAKYGNKGTLSMSDKMKILQNAIKTQATTGYNIFSIEDIFSKKTLWAEKYYEPTSGAGKFIRAPLTLLGLSDTVFKGFVFLNHADIMATNIARGEAKANGWNAEQTKARAKELFYQALNTDPTTITNIGAKIRSESLVEGAQATFTEDTKLAHYANQFRSMLNFGAKTGIGNLLIPFTSTIANIAQDAVANYTFGSIKEAIKNPSFVIQALNPMIDSEMRKEAWKTIAPEYKNLIKNAMGMLMLIWLAVCYSDDEDFVLDYNLQTEKDKDIRQNRNAPYGTAVRIGDKWVQIDIAGSAFLPLQTVLTARRHGFTADGWIKGIAGWRDLIPGVGEIESLVEEYNKTVQFNKGSDLVAVETMLTDQGTEIITRLIPAAALVNQIGNITDVSKREKYNRWYDRILGRIPGVRERLPEATSKTTGKVIPQTDVLANLISGGNIRDYVAPSVSDQARYEFLDADRGLAFRESNSRLKELGKDSKAFKQAVQKVRSRFNDRLSVLVRNPAYKAMDIEEKRKAAVQLHSQIVDQVANEYGIKKKKALKKTKK